MSKTQSLKNHARFDPVYHFFITGLYLVNLVYAGFHLHRQPSLSSGWYLVLSLAAIVPILKLRTYPLKVQDRVIRLEERLRLAILLDKPLRARITELSESQLVALRFASDAELPTLAARAVSEKLSNKEIKKNIRQWRPDYWRV